MVITRKEAKLLNLRRYFTANPCKNNHISERYTSNGECVTCKKHRVLYNKETIQKYQKRWRLVNKEHKKKTDALWYEKNRTLAINSSKNWYENNKEKVKEYKKQWYLDNKDRLAPIAKHRRASNKKQKAIYDRERRKKNPDIARQAKILRKLCKEQATPSWYKAETILIKQLYLKRDELSKLWDIELHVDHIVPLQGKTVCGLHCWDNLQLLEASLNKSKNNKFVE